MEFSAYETCAKRIEELPIGEEKHYIEELEKIEGLSWLFEYPSDSQINYKIRTSKNSQRYIAILERTLRTLDPDVQEVEKLDKVDNAYVIKMKNHSVIMQDGKLLDANILSSRTKAGVEIAGVIVSRLDGGYGFYYCDEKFPYIHSDIEKAFLSVMIQCLRDNDQLFFTTHNTDILDLSLPKHTFMFLKKDTDDENQPIKCIFASQLLKRNTDSLRHAVENDLFSTAPKVELIYEIAEL